jgi:hypothetical protein
MDAWEGPLWGAVVTKWRRRFETTKRDVGERGAAKRSGSRQRVSGADMYRGDSNSWPCHRWLTGALACIGRVRSGCRCKRRPNSQTKHSRNHRASKRQQLASRHMTLNSYFEMLSCQMAPLNRLAVGIKSNRPCLYQTTAQAVSKLI